MSGIMSPASSSMKYERIHTALVHVAYNVLQQLLHAAVRESNRASRPHTMAHPGGVIRRLSKNHTTVPQTNNCSTTLLPRQFL
jgi:hypothetical protein